MDLLCAGRSNHFAAILPMPAAGELVALLEQTGSSLTVLRRHATAPAAGAARSAWLSPRTRRRKHFPECEAALRGQGGCDRHCFYSDHDPSVASRLD